MSNEAGRLHGECDKAFPQGWPTARLCILVVGFGLLWTNLQKGFFSTRLPGSDYYDPRFASSCLLLFLCVFLFVIMRKGDNAVRALTDSKATLALLSASSGILELLICLDVPSYLTAPFAICLCIVCYGVRALLVLCLLFAWLQQLLILAYDTRLGFALAVLVSVQLFARIISSPYVVTSQTLLNLEISFSPLLSGLLFLALRAPARQPLSFPVPLGESALLKRCIPALFVCLGCILVNAALYQLTENLVEMAIFSFSRELILLVVLAACLASLVVPESEESPLNGSARFFLVAGLAVGLTVGQLFGISLGAPVLAQTFDFMQTMHALFFACSFALLFLIVYESSVSPVATFGLLLVAPDIAERLLYLPTMLIDLPFVSAETYGTFLAPLTFVFFVASALLVHAFCSSKAFAMLSKADDTSAPEEGAKTIAVKAACNEFGLTDREQEIFGYLASGYTAKMIGERLFLSPYTVQNHTRRIYEKMGVHSRQAVIDYVESHADATSKQ